MLKNKKRLILSSFLIIPLLIGLVLFGGISDIQNVEAASAKVYKSSGTYKVTANRGLNVRTGNNTKYKRVGGLTKNTKINVNGKTNNGWYRFKYKGKNRYVSGKYLKKQTTVKANTPLVKASGKYKVIGNVNVRTGNGTKYKKVGSLKKGKTITVNAKRGNWYRFNYKGKIVM